MTGDNFSPYPEDKDPEALKALIEEMVILINRLSDDRDLTAAVNSVFDSLSVQDITKILSEYNLGNDVFKS